MELQLAVLDWELYPGAAAEVGLDEAEDHFRVLMRDADPAARRLDRVQGVDEILDQPQRRAGGLHFRERLDDEPAALAFGIQRSVAAELPVDPVVQRAEEALQRARGIWAGNEYARGENRDEYYELCFRDTDPLDTEFEKLAEQVFGPLLQQINPVK